jgi:hypothetical protein
MPKTSCARKRVVRKKMRSCRRKRTSDNVRPPWYKPRLSKKALACKEIVERVVGGSTLIQGFKAELKLLEGKQQTYKEELKRMAAAAQEAQKLKREEMKKLAEDVKAQRKKIVDAFCRVQNQAQQTVQP